MCHLIKFRYFLTSVNDLMSLQNTQNIAGCIVRRVAKKVFFDKIDSSFSFSSDQLDSNIKKSFERLAVLFPFHLSPLEISSSTPNQRNILKSKLISIIFFFKCQVLKNTDYFCSRSYVVMLLSLRSGALSFLSGMLQFFSQT